MIDQVNHRADQLTPPAWLNPDAILGVVVHCGVPYYVTADDWIGNGDRALLLTRHDAKYVDSGWFRLDRCRLRRDLWPVKPELDGLFVSPPTDDEYLEAWESAANEEHF